MTMEGMVRHLESMGFETTKKYNAQKCGYDFKISKDKTSVNRFFLYPSHDSPEGRDTKQREFIDKIVDEWHYTRGVKLKGENKMDFMDYVVRGGEVCLTGNGQSMPVKLEHIEMSSLEPMRFEGHAVSLTPVDYTKPRDIGIIKELSCFCGYTNKKLQTPCKTFPGIKAVYFSGPCTVIVWDDKTKTVVRCNNENIDYEKGFAMAVAKKVFGTNKSGSNYYDVFKKYLPNPETPEEETTITETVEEEIPNVEPAE